MIIQKYNPETMAYKSYKVPDDWNVKQYSGDMDEVVNCAQCGKELRYADTYTSLEVGAAFGYGVCANCCKEEIERRAAAERKRHQESEIDWLAYRGKKVLVRNMEGGIWERQILADYLPNAKSKFATYIGSDVEYAECDRNHANDITTWKYCKLPEEDDA